MPTVIGFLQAILALESFIDQKRPLAEMTLSLDLLEHLQECRRFDVLFQQAIGAVDHFEADFKFIKEKFDQAEHWIHQIQKEKLPPSPWQSRQERLLSLRQTFWDSLKSLTLFEAVGNYQDSLLDLFKEMIKQLVEDLGQAPCEWQLCFKGSYARDDISAFFR